MHLQEEKIMKVKVENWNAFIMDEKNWEWIELPMKRKDFDEVLKRIGAQKRSDYFFSEVKSDNKWIIGEIDLDAKFDFANDLALYEKEFGNIFLALLEYEGDARSAMEIIDSNKYDYYEGTLLDLSYELVEDTIRPLTEFVRDFFDYKKYADFLGYDWLETEYGCVCVW